MPRSQRRLLIGGLIFIDMAAVALAVTAAYHLTLGVAAGWTRVAPLALVVFIVTPTGIVLFALNRLYILDEQLESPVEYGRILYACTLMAFSLSVFGFWGRDLGETAKSRILVGSLWALSILAVGGGRFVVRRLVRALRRRGLLVSRALIVGLGTPGISLARHFHDRPYAGVRVMGFIDDFLAPGTHVTGVWKVLGPPSALPRILEQTGATEVIVVPTAMAWESFQDLMSAVPGLNGPAIRLASGFRDILATNVKVHHLGFMPLLTVERVRITGFDALLKRVLDFGVALVLLPFALILTAALAVAIATKHRHPFRNVRLMGRGGGGIKTLLLNVREQEPRSSVERAICHFGLHRLPQLLNVLCCQMSMVGPRPIPFEHTEDFTRWLPNLRTVEPGLLGPWVVRGAPKSIDEEMQTNLFYIRNYSVWLDLEILARSIGRMLAGFLKAAIWNDYGSVAAPRAASPQGSVPKGDDTHRREATTN